MDWIYITTSQDGRIVLVSSQHLSLHHNTQDGRKILDWLYVKAIKLEAQY
jgi:hypothetical protein